MKKLLVTIMLVVGIFTAYGQHLEIEGIQIDGPIQKFEAKLLQKGFEPIDMSKFNIGNTPMRSYIGKILGYDGLLHVIYDPKSGTVYRCVVHHIYNRKPIADLVSEAIGIKLGKLYKDQCSKFVKDKQIPTVVYNIEGYDPETGGTMVLGDITVSVSKRGEKYYTEAVYSDMSNMLTFFDK